MATAVTTQFAQPCDGMRALCAEREGPIDIHATYRRTPAAPATLGPEWLRIREGGAPNGPAGRSASLSFGISYSRRDLFPSNRSITDWR